MNKDINKEIEEMAEKLEKSTKSPHEELITIIKSLGPDALKAKLPSLNDDEKIVLKAALEEINKAVTFDKEAQAVKHVQGKVTDTVIQEDKADDDADEKLVKPEAATHSHQGTPTDGWEGQVIKGRGPDLQPRKKHGTGIHEPSVMGESKGTSKMGMQLRTGGVENAKRHAKDTLKELRSMKKPNLTKSDEEILDLVVSKMMEKSQDSKVIFEKCIDLGLSEEEISKCMERLDKAKMSKDAASKEIMTMEEKEHGTKDPKKLVEAEKKEHKMKKSEEELELEKAKMNKEEDQLGDAPAMEGKTFGPKEDAPNIEDVPKASKKAQQDVKNTKVKKSVSWDDDSRLFKANTLGRNHNFNLEQFVTETLSKSEPVEDLKKSQPKEDLNDLIEKSLDRNWDQLNHDRMMKANADKQNGTLVKSFNDIKDVAALLNISEEEALKIIGQ